MNNIVYINGHRISIVPYNKVFMVEVVDKMGRRTDFNKFPCLTLREAKEEKSKAIAFYKAKAIA